jgi:hypothetical protein
VYITRKADCVHHGSAAIFVVRPRAGDLDAKNISPNVAEQSHKLKITCPATRTNNFSYANSVSTRNRTVELYDMVKVREGNESIAWNKQVAGRNDSKTKASKKFHSWHHSSITKKLSSEEQPGG